MQLDAATLTAAAAYKLMTGAVVPRPIAWVTTQDDDGLVNLAPFSAFTFVCSFPPVIGIGMGRREGDRKDTANNVHRSGEFVVNIGDETMIRDIHLSAADHPPHVSEVAELGLTTVPSERIGPPRLADAPISMECRLDRVLTFGQHGAEFVIANVLIFHVRDDMLSGGKIDSEKLRPVCRIAGPNYAGLGHVTRLS